MKSFKPFKYIIFFVLLIAVLPAFAASPWEKRCEAQSCEVFQRLVSRDNQARLLEVAIGFPSGKASARAVVILPLGVDLSQALAITVDDKAPLGFKVRYCLMDGCYAFLSLPPDVLATMTAGAMATISFKTFDGQPGKLPLSLEGFAADLSQIQK